MSIVIPVFIASPSDVSAERELVISAVKLISCRFQRMFGVALSPVDWKDFPPVASPKKSIVFQDAILGALKNEYDGIFVGLLSRRIGTPIKRGSGITGTESEYDFAINNRKRIKILTYLKRIDEDISQLKVSRLRSRILHENLPYQEYCDEVDFKDRIFLDLIEVVLSILFDDEARRRQEYNEFFRLGLKRGSNNASVFIVYPSIHKHSTNTPKNLRPGYDWTSRLLPNVVFEDFKAIQKLEMVLRTIDVTDYRSLTSEHPSVEMDYGNRIWICLPRNIPALRQLATLGDRPRFKFDPDTESIEWRINGTSVIYVRSPLRKYLEKTRSSILQPWALSFGNIYAKDYAVISRFKRNIPNAQSEKPFYHYFIAGIRGLGTWGAGWYIDRFSDELEKASKEADEESEDIQMLLEVEYWNYRIHSVRQITQESQDYFDDQYLDSTIEKKLREKCIDILILKK